MISTQTAMTAGRYLCNNVMPCESNQNSLYMTNELVENSTTMTIMGAVSSQSQWCPSASQTTGVNNAKNSLPRLLN